MRSFISLTILLTTSYLVGQTSVAGKDCTGIWKTVDDETGRTKSHVEVFKKGNLYYAKIIKLVDPETLKESGVTKFEDVICDDCPAGKGKDQPVIGLQMMWDMKQSEDKWEGGEIMDPKNGKIYDCTMWLDDSDSKGNTLKIRGWILFLYRTQTWHRLP